MDRARHTSSDGTTTRIRDSASDLCTAVARATTIDSKPRPSAGKPVTQRHLSVSLGLWKIFIRSKLKHVPFGFWIGCVYLGGGWLWCGPVGNTVQNLT